MALGMLRLPCAKLQGILSLVRTVHRRLRRGKEKERATKKETKGKAIRIGIVVIDTMMTDPKETETRIMNAVNVIGAETVIATVTETEIETETGIAIKIGTVIVT